MKKTLVATTLLALLTLGIAGIANAETVSPTPTSPTVTAAGSVAPTAIQPAGQTVDAKKATDSGKSSKVTGKAVKRHKKAKKATVQTAPLSTPTPTPIK
jgi:hypothetical protein